MVHFEGIMSIADSALYQRWKKFRLKDKLTSDVSSSMSPNISPAEIIRDYYHNRNVQNDKLMIWKI